MLYPVIFLVRRPCPTASAAVIYVRMFGMGWIGFAEYWRRGPSRDAFVPDSMMGAIVHRG